MKSKYISLKRIFLEQRPKLLQYLIKTEFDFESVISIEQKDNLYLFKGLGLIFQVQTDSNFSFFKSNLFLNEITCEAS